MLCELNVENLLLIERAQMRFARGLNVLTGETGAGKTVLASALDLLLGGRAKAGASSKLVRPGAGEAYVEGVFDISEALREELGERLTSEAEEIVLARRIDPDGRRTRAYVNGRTVTIAELRELGSRLLCFYGQHEHRKLTLAEAQLGILDAMCGPEQRRRLRACTQAHRRAAALQARLRELDELAVAREREIGLLEHELAEIEALAPEQAEHERLLAVRERLRRSEALCAAAGYAAESLEPEAAEGPAGAVALLAGAGARIDALAGVDASLDLLAERLRTVLVESQDLAAGLREYGEGLTGEGQSLEEVEERLAAIERLLRKHGGSIAEVLAHAEHARARRRELDEAQVAFADAERDLGDARRELERQVAALRGARQKAAPRLAGAVREQLAALAMGAAEFDVSVAQTTPGPSGGDTVEMLLAANRGVPGGPLREIASGGELARVMLAVIAASGPAGADAATLVFDEIDAGIGGHTARAVGERLRMLAESRQVICITHLPQVASLGARHFAIVKDASADPALAEVVQLGEREVVSELVRMLGAAEGDTVARRHAKDLRKAA